MHVEEAADALRIFAVGGGQGGQRRGGDPRRHEGEGVMGLGNGLVAEQHLAHDFPDDGDEPLEGRQDGKMQPSVDVAHPDVSLSTPLAKDWETFFHEAAERACLLAAIPAPAMAPVLDCSSSFSSFSSFSSASSFRLRIASRLAESLAACALEEGSLPPREEEGRGATGAAGAAGATGAAGASSATTILTSCTMTAVLSRRPVDDRKKRRAE